MENQNLKFKNRKICILGDTHFGARNDAQQFHNFFEKFYDYLFKYLADNNISTIVQVGDLFDRRKYINFNTLQECKRYFFDRCEDNNIELYALLGNHDIYYKESLLVNSPELVLSEYQNITIINSPESYTLFWDDSSPVLNTTVSFIPWICKENEKQVEEYISKDKNLICFGHLELAHFCMYKGYECEEGMTSSMFSKYEKVFTGHYHHRSSKSNILYVGTPYEMTWHDYDDPKGFHIFDFDSRELDFIENPYTMFKVIEYDDLLDKQQYVIKDYVNEYTNSYVKVIVKNKTDSNFFDVFLTGLHASNPIDVSIIEEHLLLKEDLSISESENTLDIIHRYVDTLDIVDIDATKLKVIMDKLYSEALTVA